MLRNKEKAELKQAIIDLVNNEHGRPIPPGIIVKKLLNQYKHIDNVRNLIYKHISDLINEKQFKQLPSKSIVLFNSKNNINVYTNAPIDNSQTLQGTISINSAGNGFIKLKDEKKAQYYVYKTNLNSALDGDTVEFSPMKKPSIGDLKDAVITKVISRGKDFYVGIFNLNKDGTYKISIDNQKIKMDVKLDDIHGLVNGQKILIQIKKFEKDIAYGSVSRVIGHTGDVGVDILSIVYDNGVEPEFPNNIIEYARNLKLDIDPYQRQIRKDLTNLPIVTIDPATSKDFDDAFYTKKLDGDKYFLSVSIADVSHYVRFKSELDEEALNRGCSIYLVDRVIPMLPHNLSDDLCSLNPNVERLALTCDMIINNVGAIQDIKVYPSIIKSHRRYSYDEVNAFYNKTDDLKNDPKDVKEMLLIALELHRVLDITKKKRGYINFDVPEPIIMVDKDCVPTEIKKHESGTAQRMIEDFMVAANEAVTIHANKEKWPFVYRVHDKPNEDRLKTFALEAKRLGFKIPTDIKNIKPIDISKWLEVNKDNQNLDLIHMMLLRCMAKAEYSTKNIGHFGLALKDYTHFTSPIRRYPDLMVHRIYWMYEFEKNKTNEGNRKEMSSLLEEYCEKSSKNELRSIQCERDVNQMKFAEYMSKHIGEEFEATVSSVSNFGMFVQLPNTIEGLIKLASCKDDYYTFNEKTNELVGKRKGNRYSLGTKVKVKLILADKNTRKIEFELLQHLGNR